MPKTNPPTVTISHAHDDASPDAPYATVIRGVNDRLQKIGFKVWFTSVYHQGLPWDDRFALPTMLRGIISDSDVVVGFVTEAAVASDYVRLEWDVASTLLLVRLDPMVEVPASLANRFTFDIPVGGDDPVGPTTDFLLDQLGRVGLFPIRPPALQVLRVPDAEDGDAIHLPAACSIELSAGELDMLSAAPPMRDVATAREVGNWLFRQLRRRRQTPCRLVLDRHAARLPWVWTWEGGRWWAQDENMALGLLYGENPRPFSPGRSTMVLTWVGPSAPPGWLVLDRLRGDEDAVRPLEGLAGTESLVPAVWVLERFHEWSDEDVDTADDAAAAVRPLLIVLVGDPPFTRTVRLAQRGRAAVIVPIARSPELATIVEFLLRPGRRPADVCRELNRPHPNAPWAWLTCFDAADLPLLSEDP